MFIPPANRDHVESSKKGVSGTPEPCFYSLYFTWIAFDTGVFDVYEARSDKVCLSHVISKWIYGHLSFIVIGDTGIQRVNRLVLLSFQYLHLRKTSEVMGTIILDTHANPRIHHVQDHVSVKGRNQVYI